MCTGPLAYGKAAVTNVLCLSILSQFTNLGAKLLLFFDMCKHFLEKMHF